MSVELVYSMNDFIWLDTRHKLFQNRNKCVGLGYQTWTWNHAHAWQGTQIQNCFQARFKVPSLTCNNYCIGVSMVIIGLGQYLWCLKDSIKRSILTLFQKTKISFNFLLSIYLSTAYCISTYLHFFSLHELLWLSSGCH